MLASQQSVAVIGGGVAGLVSAYLLSQKYTVTIFEAEERLGGHTNTVTIQTGPDAGLGVDTGFIVLNDQTYPLFHKFLNRLGVGVRWSDMSFSYYSEAERFYYAGTDLNGLFAQRMNLVKPSFYRFLLEIARFCRDGQAMLAAQIPEITLREFVQRQGYHSLMVSRYLAPMAAAIWSSPANEVLDFPLATFLRFFANHGLLKLKDRPRWQTVVGGSSTYVRRFQELFNGSIQLNSPVALVSRTPTDVRIRTRDGEQSFDYVIIATHADTALQILADPSEVEKLALEPWHYNKNYTVLHTDTSLLPPTRRAWASWNYLESEANSLTVTYYMNRLQGFNSNIDYCVSLNPNRSIRDAKIVKELTYHHPVYTYDSIRAQQHLALLPQNGRTHFCGSYHGNGFHEDAVRSANELCRKFGLEL